MSIYCMDMALHSVLMTQMHFNQTMVLLYGLSVPGFQGRVSEKRHESSNEMCLSMSKYMCLRIHALYSISDQSDLRTPTTLDNFSFMV